MPKTFTDGAGITRAVVLTVGTLETVREATGIDLYCPTEPTENPAKERSLVARFHYEPRTLMNVVALLVEPVIAPAEIGAWLKQQTAESISAARAALLVEWESFFRVLGREELAEILLAELAFVEQLRKQCIQRTQKEDIAKAASERLDKALQERNTEQPSGSGEAS